MKPQDISEDATGIIDETRTYFNRAKKGDEIIETGFPLSLSKRKTER